MAVKVAVAVAVAVGVGVAVAVAVAVGVGLSQLVKVAVAVAVGVASVCLSPWLLLWSSPSASALGAAVTVILAVGPVPMTL